MEKEEEEGEGEGRGGKKQKSNRQYYCFNLFPPSVHTCRKLEGNSDVPTGAWDAGEELASYTAGEKKKRVESGAQNHAARFHQRPVIKSQFIFTSCRLSRAREQLGADLFDSPMSLASGAARGGACASAKAKQPRIIPLMTRTSCV